jgi:hypothetical protein
MVKITEKQLIKAIDKINGLDSKKYTKFIEDFAKKQPDLVTYMVVSTENLSDPAARDEVIYLLSVIWEAYLSLNVPLSKITNKEIEKMEAQQILAWEKLAEITDDKEEEAFTKKFISQPNIWSFMNELVMPEYNPESCFKNEDDIALTYAIINLAIVLLNDRVKKGAAKN